MVVKMKNTAKLPPLGLSIEYVPMQDGGLRSGAPVFALRLALAYMCIFGTFFTANAFAPSECNVQLICTCILLGTPVLGALISYSMTRTPSLIAACAVLAIVVYRWFDAIYEGALYAVNSYITLTWQGSPEASRLAQITAAYPEGFASTAFFGTAMAVITLAVCVGIFFRTSLLLVFAVSFPVLEMGLYYGMVPPYPAAIALTAAWLSLLAIQISEMSVNIKSRRSDTLAAMSGLLVALTVAAVFSASYAYYSQKGFHRPESIVKIRNNTILYMDDISTEKIAEDIRQLEAYVPQKSVGGTSEGKLGQTDKISFSGQTVLEVTLPQDSSTTYLKGYSGTSYSGHSWDRMSFENSENLSAYLDSLSASGYNPQYLTGQFWQLYDKSYMTTVIKVKNVSNAKKLIYQPYFSLERSGLDRREFIEDAYILAKGSTEYSFNSYARQRDSHFEGYGEASIYLPGLLTPNEGVDKYAQAHDIYSNVVMSVCLDAGEENNRLAYEVFGYDYFNGSVTLYTYLQDMRDLLGDRCSYDLEAGKLSEGEDFVRKFLFDTHKGSCTHFASSAVLMLRSAGIPARYAEGFMISESDIRRGESDGKGNVTVSVKDSSAHAWAEVYISGYGWIPVEMTPGYSSDEQVLFNPAEEITHSTLPQESIPEEESTEATAQTTVTLPAFEETSREPVIGTGGNGHIGQGSTAQAEDTEQNGDENEAVQSYDESEHYGAWAAGAMLLVILSAAGIFRFRRKLIVDNRRSVLRNGSDNDAVCAAYEWFVQLAVLSGCAEKPESMGYNEYAELLAAVEGLPQTVSAYDIVQARLDADFGGQSDHTVRKAVAAAAERYAEHVKSSCTVWQRLIYEYIKCVF